MKIKTKNGPETEFRSERNATTSSTEDDIDRHQASCMGSSNDPRMLPWRLYLPCCPYSLMPQRFPPSRPYPLGVSLELASEINDSSTALPQRVQSHSVSYINGLKFPPSKTHLRDNSEILSSHYFDDHYASSYPNNINEARSRKNGGKMSGRSIYSLCGYEITEPVVSMLIIKWNLYYLSISYVIINIVCNFFRFSKLI